VKLCGANSLIPRWLIPIVALVSLGLAAQRDSRLVDAAARDDDDAVRTLLERAADVNAAAGDGTTALHWAAHWDDQALAERLIRAGASVNASTDLGVTPLWLACENRSVAMVERLLSAGADPNMALRSGETPLMMAARSGDPLVVKLLLDRGADVNAKESTQDQTALMWAAAQRHSAAVDVLLARGADVNARSRTWIEVVNPAGSPDSRATLVDVEEGGFTPLLFAAQHGDAESATLLIARGANVNDAAPAGPSALVVAAHSGHGNVGAVLLEHGADPNAAQAGYTALHAAVLRKDLELVKALLTHGADPSRRVDKATPARRSSRDYALTTQMVGATPFWLAASVQAPEIMRVLAASGADPRFALSGRTALLTALSGRRRLDDPIVPEDEPSILETVKMAIKLGADVNAADSTDTTALHLAAAGGFNTVIQWLADHGASLDAKNQTGRTPLAIADPDSSTAALLLKLGARPDPNR
jgi:ankyrin repeat protein